MVIVLSTVWFIQPLEACDCSIFKQSRFPEGLHSSYISVLSLVTKSLVYYWMILWLNVHTTDVT